MYGGILMEISMNDFKSYFIGEPIEKEQVVKGMHLCFMNAKAMVDESRLLKENGHHARALSLIILALEELGKIPIMMNAIILKKDDYQAWKKFWKELQKHKIKISVWSVYGKLLAKFPGKGYETEFLEGIESLADKFKQLGFYVSFFKGEFLYPEDIAKDNYEWLEYFMEAANERIDSFETLHGSLESSKRFVDNAEELIKTVKKAKTKEELKNEITEYLKHKYKENR